MTPETTHELVLAGESLDVEFKGEERRALNDRDLVEAVVCLANRHSSRPGYLLVGVEDDGRITGARPRHETGRTEPERVAALIASRTRPSLACEVEEVVLEGHLVLAVTVPVSRVPVASSDGTYLRRTLTHQGAPECLPMFYHEMQSAQADRGLLDPTALELPGASWHDLDPMEFERFRRMVRESRSSDRVLVELPDTELAKALGVVKSDHQITGIRLAGLLLFGREEALARMVPAHQVAFQKLEDTRIPVNVIERWPLLRAMEEFLRDFRAANLETEVRVGILRVAVPDYPEAAVREALANAFVHRDYGRLGAVHLQWREDSLEVSSPGSFPEGVRLDNLLVVPPTPRNPLLADAFKRAGVVERTGRGIDRIFEEQLRNGRPVPDYSRSTGAHVVVVLPGGTANLDFVRLVSEEGQEGPPLRLDELMILNHLWLERTITTAESARLMQRSEGEARMRLQRLVERGLLEGRGEGRGRTYHLSATAYRRLGLNAAYVRQRGFEPFQIEQMVLQFVHVHQRITRKEAADLCRLDPPKAGRLLQSMARRGALIREGSRRGSSYVAPPSDMNEL